MCTAEPLLVIVTGFGTVIVIVALFPAAQLLAGTPEEAASEGRSSQGEGEGLRAVVFFRAACFCVDFFFVLLWLGRLMTTVRVVRQFPLGLQ